MPLRAADLKILYSLKMWGVEEGDRAGGFEPTTLSG